jgi:hypothetical protein
MILWWALQWRALQEGWSDGFWSFWQGFHGAFVGVSLAIAVVLTAYSLGVYLWRYRTIVSDRGR